MIGKVMCPNCKEILDIFVLDCAFPFPQQCPVCKTEFEVHGKKEWRGERIYEGEKIQI